MKGGVATFTDLADQTAEVVSLVFSGGGLTSAPTGTITVGPAAASQLVIATPPSTAATAGTAFPTQPVIEEKDNFGNLETGDDTTLVTAALASGTGPLQGTKAITVQGGVATFTDLADDLAETITLSFSGGGLSVGPSKPITVSAAGAAKLVIQAEPSDQATAGAAFGSTPAIVEEDEFGNVETGDSTTAVTATLTKGTGKLSGGTTVTLTDGVASFPTLADDTAGTFTLSFTGGGLTSPASSPFTVSPAGASMLVVQTPPSSGAMAGTAFTVQPVVAEEDQYGNLESGDNTTVVTATLE